jgi:hydroxymethylglutaryl-CoA lyase
MHATRPSSVELVEVCPRDGLQNDTMMLPTATKVALIRRLGAAGLRRIEVASFVNPKRVPQMADADAVAAALGDSDHPMEGVRLSALVLNERGFDRALGTILHEITFVIVASETFSERNQGVGTTQSLAAWRRLSPRIAAAGLRSSVTIGAAFGCPFEGEVPGSRVLALAQEIADIGTDELSLADTIGVGSPAEVEERFGMLRAKLPGMKLRAHFHNTRNTGLANADAALRAGVTVLDASLGGLGGCPFAPGASGNIGTEDLAYMLDRSRVAHDGTFAALCETTLWLEAEMGGRRLPAQTAHVNMFPRLAA